MEIVVAALVLGISALAFVAYNHPRQFVYIGYACIAWQLLSWFAVVIVSRVNSKNLSLVKNSGIPPEHIETVVKALTDTSAPDWLHVLVYAIIYLPFYVGFLWLLPALGLTAEAREQAIKQAAR